MKTSKLFLISIIVFIFLTGYFTNQAVQASGAAPGSSSDPLITKSYLDSTKDFKGDMVVLVRIDDFTDAMVASAIVAKYNATIMYTDTKKLSSSTKSALEKLKPGKVIILGGTLAVSTTVETEVKTIIGSSGVQRIYGETRFDTPVEVTEFLTGKSL